MAAVEPALAKVLAEPHPFMRSRGCRALRTLRNKEEPQACRPSRPRRYEPRARYFPQLLRPHRPNSTSPQHLGCERARLLGAATRFANQLALLTHDTLKL